MKSQLSLDPPGQHHFIRSVSADGIRIGDELYRESLVVAADSLITDWSPGSLDDLKESDLEPLLVLEPEVVLLGTGARQAFLPASRLAPLYRAGIGVEMMTTDAACRTFNILASEERRVVAGLFPIRDQMT